MSDFKFYMVRDSVEPRIIMRLVLGGKEIARDELDTMELEIEARPIELFILAAKRLAHQSGMPYEDVIRKMAPQVQCLVHRPAPRPPKKEEPDIKPEPEPATMWERLVDQVGKAMVKSAKIPQARVIKLGDTNAKGEA